MAMILDPFLNTDGIHNFRDYGGYAVAGGGRVRRGLLFRSGQHFEASEADLEAVHALDIRTIIDLRGESERGSYPCRRHAEFDAEIVAYPGETTSAPPHEGGPAARGMDAKFAMERMIALYKRMPENPAMIVMFGRFLEAVEQRDGGSLVHCFAGKDRTGIAATMLLHILGVHHDDIVEEFLLTNRAPSLDILIRQALPGMEAKHGPLGEDAVRSLLEVKPEYVETYIATVQASHGSLDNYLTQVIGVDESRRERLKERLVA